MASASQWSLHQSGAHGFELEPFPFQSPFYHRLVLLSFRGAISTIAQKNCTGCVEIIWPGKLPPATHHYLPRGSSRHQLHRRHCFAAQDGHFHPPWLTGTLSLTLMLRYHCSRFALSTAQTPGPLPSLNNDRIQMGFDPWGPIHNTVSTYRIYVCTNKLAKTTQRFHQAKAKD